MPFARFMPGLTDGHGGECPDCRQWAKDIESLRAFGANLALPGALRSRLEQMPAGRGMQDLGPVGGTLPQIPLPSDLMAKLYRIPSESRLMRARGTGPCEIGRDDRGERFLRCPPDPWPGQLPLAGRPPRSQHGFPHRWDAPEGGGQPRDADAPRCGRASSTAASKQIGPWKNSWDTSVNLGGLHPRASGSESRSGEPAAAPLNARKGEPPMEAARPIEANVVEEESPTQAQAQPNPLSAHLEEAIRGGLSLPSSRDRECLQQPLCAGHPVLHGDRLPPGPGKRRRERAPRPGIRHRLRMDFQRARRLQAGSAHQLRVRPRPRAGGPPKAPEVRPGAACSRASCSSPSASSRASSSTSASTSPGRSITGRWRSWPSVPGSWSRGSGSAASGREAVEENLP